VLGCEQNAKYGKYITVGGKLLVPTETVGFGEKFWLQDLAGSFIVVFLSVIHRSRRITLHLVPVAKLFISPCHYDKTSVSSFHCPSSHLYLTPYKMSGDGATNLVLLNSEAPVQLVNPPYPKSVGEAVANSTLRNFALMIDGTPYFLVDGQK
jgi:hypothetical protein